MTTVLLADDQELFAESLARVVVTLEPDIRVVGIAKNGAECVQMAKLLDPDIVLLDVRMPEVDGVEAVRMIHQQNPRSKVIMLTTFDDDEYVYEALRNGAVGYLLKDMKPEKLVADMRAVATGSVLMAESVAMKLLGKPLRENGVVRESGTQELPPRPVWWHDLSYREREVASYLSKGFDNREIAAAMFLADQTVRNHVSSIYTKTGLTDRVKLVELLKQGQKPV